MDYFYIFYTNKGFNIYERTTMSIKSAKERVKQLKMIYENATYFKNKIPKKYKWLY